MDASQQEFDFGSPLRDKLQELMPDGRLCPLGEYPPGAGSMDRWVYMGLSAFMPGTDYDETDALADDVEIVERSKAYAVAAQQNAGAE